MHVIVVSSLNLARQYGASASTRLLRRLDALERARRARGLATLRLVPEESLPELDLAPVDPADHEALRLQILRLAEALLYHGDSLESVLLLGGPTALPFFRCPNPVNDDDPWVLSDYRYGEREDDLLMDWPVGRLPAGPDDDPRGLLRLLVVATHLHRRPLPAPAARRAFGYSAAAWQRAAEEVYAQIDAPARLLLSPPITAGTLNLQLLAGASRVFCNLHGVPTRSTWYGEAPTLSAQLEVALRPRDLLGLSMIGAAVVCTSCYGAYAPAYNLGNTIALHMLRQGAACFVGATGISYGPATLPLIGADLLAYHLLGAAEQPALRAGDVFRLARERTLADTLRRQGALDDDDAKTLAQFVLYGDPTLRIGP